MATNPSLRPVGTGELADAIADATRDGRRLAICGGGSKQAIGAPASDAIDLHMSAFSDVVDYDPPELVLTAGAATPLSELEALVASRGQALAFDPFDYGRVLGGAAGASTIGGVIAAGVAGPCRLTQGAARDHLLGFEAVSGRGERFVAGAKVVKNVTGYDLPKLMAGSWGRLAALTQVTLKVLPRPETRLTKLFVGLNLRDALRLMATAMRSPAEVRAAAHIPCAADYADRSVTALLLTGFAASVEARSKMVDALLDLPGQTADIADQASTEFWRDVAVAASLRPDRPLWRITAPASRIAAVTEALGLDRRDQLFDWAGGLMWIVYEGDAAHVRAAAEGAGGQAMLVRASPGLRAATPTFHPPAPGVAALEARVRRAFDPLGVFETGRF